MAGADENSAALSELTRNETVCEDSFAGPGEMLVAQPATVCGPASSKTVWSAPLTKLGASFTGVTVIVNVCGALVSTPPLAVPPSSWARTVTVAHPLASGAGV